MSDKDWSDEDIEEARAKLTSKERDNLDDSDFAYIDKDGDRHLPIHDANHVKAALSRFGQTQFDSPDDKPKAAKKIVAAAKKFGIDVSADSAVGKAAGLKQENSAHPRAKNRARSKRDLPVMPEYRRYRIAPKSIEMRAISSDDGSTITQLNGVPIAYNTAYTVTDMFGEFSETMHPGVASGSITNGDDVRFLLNHAGLPMARTASGTLTLDDSSDGLCMSANVDRAQSLANDLCIAIERGDITQMSVGFEVLADNWNEDYTVRDIYQVRLFDVSAVTYPASPTTSIGLAQRALMEQPVESRERLRRMWQVSKDLRSGDGLAQRHGEILMAGLETLATADEAVEDEERAQPTADDPGIATKIMAAKAAVEAAKAAQMNDSDMGTDPRDAQVLAHLEDACDALGEALQDQAMDQAAEAQPETKRDDDETQDSAVQTDPDGTNTGGAGNAPLPDNGDGTGSRSARHVDVEVELAEMRANLQKARAIRAVTK